MLKDSFSPELGRARLGDFVDRFLGNLERIPASIGEAFTVAKDMLAGSFFTQPSPRNRLRS